MERIKKNTFVAVAVWESEVTNAMNAIESAAPNTTFATFDRDSKTVTFDTTLAFKILRHHTGQAEDYKTSKIYETLQPPEYFDRDVCATISANDSDDDDEDTREIPTKKEMEAHFESFLKAMETAKTHHDLMVDFTKGSKRSRLAEGDLTYFHIAPATHNTSRAKRIRVFIQEAGAAFPE